MAINPKKILLVSSEAVPFAKSGGLGDMVSALAIALKRLGHDVRILLPRYYAIDKAQLKVMPFSLGVPMGWGEQWCALYEGQLPKSEVPIYFLEHEGFFGRNGIYGPDTNSSFEDNFARYTLLSRGAFQACKALNWIPNIVHGHDWPTALTAVYLNTWERNGLFQDTASVFTIHNLGYQGWFPRYDLFWAQLNEEDFIQQGLEALGSINLMKSGITASNMITTVSPTYAAEIQGEEYGEGQAWLLRQRSDALVGILNGIDMQTWDPSSDKYLSPDYYWAKDLTNKAKIKLRLQERMGLPVRADVPVIAMISRLVSQKGVELLLGEWGVLARLRHYHPDVQVAIVGTGEQALEDGLRYWAAQHSDHISVVIDYDEPLSHLMEGGADFFLMPSRYEPCGLNQMYSLRYGTLPIVRRTGGLVDTVMPYDERSGGGTGWLFNDYNVDGCWWAVNYAIETYYQRPKHIMMMRQRAMEQDFSWDRSALSYDRAYDQALIKRQNS